MRETLCFHVHLCIQITYIPKILHQQTHTDSKTMFQAWISVIPLKRNCTSILELRWIQPQG